MLNGRAQKSRAHGGARFIKHPQKAALFILCEHGLAKLKISSCAEIHFEILRVYVKVYIFYVRYIALLGMLNIFERRACRAHRGHELTVARKFTEPLFVHIKRRGIVVVRKTRRYHNAAVLGIAVYIGKLREVDIGDYLAGRIC